MLFNGRWEVAQDPIHILGGGGGGRTRLDTKYKEMGLEAGGTHVEHEA